MIPDEIKQAAWWLDDRIGVLHLSPYVPVDVAKAIRTTLAEPRFPKTLSKVQYDLMHKAYFSTNYGFETSLRMACRALYEHLQGNAPPLPISAKPRTRTTG